MSKKVALMCGHGTMTNGVWDAGCSYGKYTEAGLMLPITKSAVKHLREQGVTVYSDADKGNKKNMIADVAWANKKNVDIYISVHCDYYKAPSGVMPLYVSSKGKKLAKALNKSIKNGIPMKSRGVCKRTDLYELNYTDAPACILETGSIKADLKILKNDAEDYGILIAKGICNYLGITYKEESKTESTTETNKTETTKTTMYRVRKTWSDAKSQVGAFTELGNAKAVCDKHPGYSVFDEDGKAVYTSIVEVKAPSAAAKKILERAKEYSYAKGTKYAKYSYKKGAPKDAYKKALKKFMKKTAKISRSDCGYFVSTCVRASGVDSDFLALKGNADPFPAVPKQFKVVWKGKKIPNGVLLPGDIIRYKKTNGSQHTLMIYADGVIAEAQRGTAFPARKKDTKKYNKSNVKFKTLQVLRAK